MELRQLRAEDRGSDLDLDVAAIDTDDPGVVAPRLVGHHAPPHLADAPEGVALRFVRGDEALHEFREGRRRAAPFALGLRRVDQAFLSVMGMMT